MNSARVFKRALLISLRNFRRRKFRTALTVLGVVVGISTIVALVAVVYGAREHAVGFLSEATDFMVVPRGARQIQAELPERLVKQVSLYPEVESAGPVLSQMVFVDGQFAWGMGVNEQTYEIISIPLLRGSLLQANETQVVVGNTLASQLNVDVNDNIKMGPSPSEPGSVFVVSGILQPTGSITDMGCYLYLSKMQELIRRRGRISMVMVKLRDPRLGDSFKEKVEKAHEDLQVVEPEQISESLGEVLDTMNSVLIAIASISLLVGGLGIMNTTMVSVLERTREIGIMKAIGAKRSHVLTIFLVESVITSLVGGIVGVASGVVLANVVSKAIPRLMGFPAPIKIFPALLAIPVGLSMALGLTAGFYPAWKGANVRPIEAIRYE